MWEAVRIGKVAGRESSIVVLHGDFFLSRVETITGNVGFTGNLGGGALPCI